MKRKRIKQVLIFIAVFLTALIIALIVILPPSKGEAPKFVDAEGNIIPSSISEKIIVDIGDTQLGMIILGENDKNPVLLVCGGGPGIPEYLMEDMWGSVLTKHFVVCYFDYRGTGLSYNSDINPNEMTTEQYLADVDEITDYLRERFASEKIYILGHSFGTYMAINAVHDHPEKYKAYLAVSQITNQYESECIAYDYMLEQYKSDNNFKMLSEFEKYPIHTSEEAFMKYHVSSLRDKAMHELGVGTTRDMRSVISGIFLPSLRCKTYTIGERISIWRGKIKSNTFAVTTDAFNYNAFDSIESIEIPIYFFAGEFDYTCCESLQKKYFEYIKAPTKEYFLYPNVAHSPIFEDDEMTEKFLEKVEKNNEY